MRRWRTSAARPQEPSRLHARPLCVQSTSWPLCASRCLGRVVGRDSSRGQLSPKFDAGRTGCKVAAATHSDGWVASRLQAARASHLDTFVRTCALGWRQSPPQLSGCSGRRAIDPPSSGRPSCAPRACVGSSGSLRVHALLIPSRDQELGDGLQQATRLDHELHTLDGDVHLLAKCRWGVAAKYRGGGANESVSG